MRHLKKIMSFILTLAILLTGFAGSFTSVYAEENKYQNEDKAKTLYQMGLFKGTSESTFTPDLGSQLNRQQGFAMIIRLLGKSEEAEALTKEQVESTLKKFLDGSKIEPSLQKSVAYAIINGLVKGDGTNLMPQESMSGKDFATLILRNLGYKDSEFKYEYACSELADRKGISISEAVKLNDKELSRDDLVGIAFSALKTEGKDGKTVIEKLIEEKPELAEKSEKAGIFTDKENIPTSSPSQSASPSSSPTNTTSTNGRSSSSHSSSTPTPTPSTSPEVTPTSSPEATPTPTPSPEVTPTPVPEVALDYTAAVVGTKKIQLDFNKTIDIEQASITLKRNGLETVISNTYSSEDNTKLILVTAVNIMYGSYEISVNGLSENTITKVISAENEKVARIHLLSTKAYLNTNNKHEILAYYRIYNQYNEDMTLIDYDNIVFTAGPYLVNKIDKNTLSIMYPYDEVSIGQLIPISIVYFENYDLISTTSFLKVEEKGENYIDPRVDMSTLRLEFTKPYVLSNIFDTTNKSIIGEVHIYDQYYNDITQLYYNDPNISIKSDKGTLGSIDEKGKFIINSDSEFHIEDTVALSVYHKTLGLEETRYFSVIKGADIYEAHVTGVYNKDNLELTVNNLKSNKFYLLFDVRDEYGLTVTDLTYIQNNIRVYSSNIGLIGLNTQFIHLPIGSTNKVAMEIIPYSNPVETGGAVIISAVNMYNGLLYKYTVTVSDGPKVNIVDLNPIDYAILGEKTIIPFTAYDDNGNEVNNLDYLLDRVSVTSSAGSAYFQMNEYTGKVELILDLTDADYTSVVNIIATTESTTTNPPKSRSLFVSAKSRELKYITGLDEKVAKNLFVDGGSTRILPTYLKIQDQFGNDIDMELFSSSLYRISISISDTEVLSFNNNLNVEFANFSLDSSITNIYPTIYAKGRGKANVRISLEKVDYQYSSPRVITSYIYEINVFDRQDIISYSFAEIPTVYVDSDAYYGIQTPIGNTGYKNTIDSHSVLPVVEGILADGKKVTIPYKNKNSLLGENYLLYSDNATVVVEVQSSNSRLKISDPLSVTFENGITQKEYPIRAVVKGYNSFIEIIGNVKLSNIAPQVENIVLRPDIELIRSYSNTIDPVTNSQPTALISYKKLAHDKISISFDDLNNIETSKTAPTMADKITALVNRVVKMTDQYGKSIVASSSSYSSILPSYTYYNDPSEVCNYAFKSVNITDIIDIQGSSIPLEQISGGYRFIVNATTENGKNITFTVIVK